MKAQYLIIEHRSSKVEDRLRMQLKDAHEQIDKLRREHLALQHKFGWEVNLNNELIDLCKEYGVPYRELLDYSKNPF